MRPSPTRIRNPRRYLSTSLSNVKKLSNCPTAAILATLGHVSRTSHDQRTHQHFDDVDEILANWHQQRPDLDPTAMGVFGRLLRLSTLSQIDLATMLDEHELTIPSFDVLANLRRSEPPHSKTPSDLAASSMMSTGGMTFRIDRLEQQGLVRRIRSEHDRRVVHVQLTPAGLELMDDLIARHMARKTELLSGLSATEVTTLTKLLAKLEASWPTNDAASDAS